MSKQKPKKRKKKHTGPTKRKNFVLRQPKKHMLETGKHLESENIRTNKMYYGKA